MAGLTLIFNSNNNARAQAQVLVLFQSKVDEQITARNEDCNSALIVIDGVSNWKSHTKSRHAAATGQDCAGFL